jgi:hypothetical protein
MDTEAPQSDRLVKSEGIHLSQHKTIYDKAECFKGILLELHKEYKIDEVIVEEALQAFRRGFSSAKTLSTLAKFNGIICYLAEDIFKIPVELVNVSHARSSLGIKIDRKSEVSLKDQVFDWVSNRSEFETFPWPTKTLKSGPRKGKTINDACCYDIADASVMSLYRIHQL